MAVTGSKEPWLSWRRSGFIFMALLVLVLLYTFVPSRPFDGNTNNSQHSFPTQVGYLKGFGNASADNEAIDGLTDAQCSAIFPGLYQDIDRAVAYWKQQNHVIAEEDMEISSSRAAMRIIIHENELRILESKEAVDRIMASPDRALGVLHLIQRACDSSMAAGEMLPTVEITLNFQDDAEPPEGDTHSFWTFARTISKQSHERLWLMPNFDFWYYRPTGSFGDAVRDAMQHDGSFSEKIPKVVWRGNAGFNPELRGALVDIAKGKGWADVANVQSPEDWMKVEDFCKYAMTVYTEGVTYSGRLKFLMNCQSLLLVHEVEYATHYSHLLVKDGSDQNYVQVKRDWSDLESKVGYYLEHPDEAEKIIANSLTTFRSRYTTRAATSCYIRRLIQGYSSVSYTPAVNVATKEGGFTRRGCSYERFMDNPQDLDYEHLE